MHTRTKTSLTLVVGVVAALLIFAGGFLLGAHPGVGGFLQERLQSGKVSSADSSSDYQLQQEVLQKLQSTYYREIDPGALEAPAIEGMLAGLGDPYTVYMDPEEYATFLEDASGAYSGVGMTVEMKDHLVTVVSTFKGTPAELGGIKPGDIVVSVDGVSTDGESLDEVVSRIKGPEGTVVVLGIYRVSQTAEQAGEAASKDEESGADAVGESKADSSFLPVGGEKLTFTLTRRKIEIPVTERKILEVQGHRVALVSFFTFSEGSAGRLQSEMAEALSSDQAQAIILDLRYNGGGLLDQAVKVASLFLPDGLVVVSTEGLHSPKQVYESQGGPFTAIPLCVLTNEYTASASEIVCGALQDHGRASIVGGTTFGKGLVQSIEPLSNGGAIKVTTAVYLTPNGRDINETGISPNVEAPDDPATTEVDETVEKALEILASELGE